MHLSMRRRLSRRGLLATAGTLAAALSLSACSFQDMRSGTDGLERVKVSTIGLTTDGSIVTGMKKGFFAEEGIELDLSLVANPPAGLAAAQSGQVDVAYSPSTSILVALSRKMPIRIVGPADGFGPESATTDDPEQFDDTALFASKARGITSLDQLAGKTIAVPARKAQLEVTIAGALDKAGVDPKSINWVVLDFTSAVTALKQGQVDAAGLVNPFTARAKANGAIHLLAPSLEFFGPSAVGMWTTGTSTLEEKPETIKAFQRAARRSNAYANAHPEEAMKAGLEYTHSQLSVDELTTPYWPTSIDPADLESLSTKLVTLDILSQPVDLSGVLLPAPEGPVSPAPEAPEDTSTDASEKSAPTTPAPKDGEQ